jgi:tetratricopeptide (TPR) repeat protein
MSSLGRRSADFGFLLVAVLAAASSGCHVCEDHEGAQVIFDLAEFNYKNLKFDQAKILYGKALEKCEGREDVLIGLANACREFGNDEYRAAADMASQNKIGEAKRIFQEAGENHSMAHQIFQTLLKKDAGDMRCHYGLGLLFYQRATSMLPFPYPVEDKVNRQKDRDTAIVEFKLVLGKVDQAWQAHRYLGLALFAAGRMDEGRYHLMKFHDSQQLLYEKIITWPGTLDEEKARKEKALAQVDKEISSIREVLGEYFMVIGRERDRLAARKDRTPEEEQNLAKHSRESLELENIIRSFRPTNLGPVEVEVRQRCKDYIETFNRGVIAEIMTFIDPPSGQEAAVQKLIQDKVGKGTQYCRTRYRTIVVSGNSATVGLVCEVVTSRGSKPDTEATFRWKLVGGQWKVADQP